MKEQRVEANLPIKPIPSREANKKGNAGDASAPEPKALVSRCHHCRYYQNCDFCRPHSVARSEKDKGELLIHSWKMVRMPLLIFSLHTIVFPPTRRLGCCIELTLHVAWSKSRVRVDRAESLSECQLWEDVGTQSSSSALMEFSRFLNSMS